MLSVKERSYEEIKLVPTFNDIALVTGEPQRPGVWCQIGHYYERNEKMERLNKFNERYNLRSSINPFKDIYEMLYYSLFKLRKQQQDEINFLYLKYYKQYIHRRPTLFAALIYYLGIPIIDILEIMGVNHNMDQKKILRVFSELKLTRKMKTDKKYWFKRFFDLVPLELQKQILPELNKYFKLKIPGAPHLSAAGCFYKVLKKHKYNRIKVGNLLGLSHLSVRRGCYNLRDLLNTNGRP